jgi:hypothetical protein
MKRSLLFVAACGLLFGAGPVEAQWSFRASPWVWFNSLNGDVRADGGIPVEIEGSVSDADFAPMLTFSGSNGRIGFLVDLAFTSGDATARDALGATARLVDVDNFIGTGLFTYDVTPGGGAEVDVGAGLRFLNSKLVVPPVAGGTPEEGKKTFVDPVFALAGVFGDRLNFTAYADMGGFGISSDFTYMLYGAIGYQFTGTTSAQAGYRLISHNTMDSDQFLYDVRQGGFLFGVAFNF